MNLRKERAANFLASVLIRSLAEVPIAPPLLNIAGMNSPPSCEIILSE